MFIWVIFFLYFFPIKGIYPPTSGTATILGRDIVREMDSIRTSIGFCPQHDILYEDLNVQEHLEIIALVCSFFDSEKLKKFY